MPIIIVTGFLATLKSTIAKRLSLDLGITSIHKDDIKEVLVDSIGFENREENMKLSVATFKIMKYLVAKYSSERKMLLVEANFKRNELDELKAIIPPKEVLTVFLDGKPTVLYDRFNKRQKHRHPAHTSTGEISYDVFESSLSEHHVDFCFGEVISIDTTVFTDTMFKELLESVRNFLNPIDIRI